MTTDPDLPVIREAVRLWCADVAVVAPPRMRIRWWRPLAAALVLVASGWALSHAVPGDDPAAPPLRIVAAAAPTPGIVAPPSGPEVLMRATAVVEVRVTAATKTRLTAERTAVLAGDGDALPARFDIEVPAGVSELEAEEVKARADESLLLLLARRDGKWVLATGNTWSLVGARSTLFLWTTDMHDVRDVPYARCRAMVVAALRLRGRLLEAPWEGQAAPLVEALRDGDPLCREFAIAWYAGLRQGWPLLHEGDRVAAEEPLPPLPAVDRAALALALPAEGRSVAFPREAAAVLAPLGGPTLTSWLSDAERAEATVVVLRELTAPGANSAPAGLSAALERVAAGDDAVAAYLARGLLGRGDAVRATRLEKAESERLAGWRHVPAWPPAAFVEWQAGPRR